MHRHELDEATDAFVAILQGKLPPHLSSFGPATPERLREVARPHIEGIVGASEGKVLEDVAPLVADLLRLLSVEPAQMPPVEQTLVKPKGGK